jgi:hypothetical protein
MGLCIIQQEIDWMLSGVNHFGKPSLFPSDYRGRTVMGVSREWGDDATRGTIGRVDGRLGERGCDGCCG